MKISVLIPAYNCAHCIRTTLDAVLRQTITPYEILVMNDGSTDDTLSVLKSYGSKITIYSQPNKGLATARNELLARATGDLIAYLDSDDIWHPKYLEAQAALFSEHPESVAFFSGHANFYGDGDYTWESDPSEAKVKAELISALDFFNRYNKATGPFSCFSYCCVPRKVLLELGNEPFREMGAEDSYCLCALTLLGHPFVLAPAEFVAYRIHKNSMSHNHVLTFGVWVRVFELLDEPFKKTASPTLYKAFRTAFASKRRSYAKMLLAAGRTPEARDQVRRSLANSRAATSRAKSLGILFFSYLPKPLQPKWDPGQRQWKEPEKTRSSGTERRSGLPAKISVIIPAYNAQATIGATLDSVLRQTLPADEILVMDDGSTDRTIEILRKYEPWVTVLRQANAGVASARNALCQQARGDLVAFLDSDDLWHESYLEHQARSFEKNRGAAAFFTGHVDFAGTDNYRWSGDPGIQPRASEVISPLEFVKRYNMMPGAFACVSYCCVPKRVLHSLGVEPFSLRVAEDLYFFNTLAPLGAVVFDSAALVAYRVREDSLSSDRLALTRTEVEAFELLRNHYRQLADRRFSRQFSDAFASKRRTYARVLLGMGDLSAAREQLRVSLMETGNPLSFGKSIALLALSYLPGSLQPVWPPRRRTWNSSDKA
jgi:glycosyltransferase involved in cell wall biosynthesis